MALNGLIFFYFPWEENAFIVPKVSVNTDFMFGNVLPSTSAFIAMVLKATAMIGVTPPRRRSKVR